MKQSRQSRAAAVHRRPVPRPGNDRAGSGGDVAGAPLVGATAVSQFSEVGAGLSYRGYDIVDLAVRASFEEVAFLLIRGELPGAQELSAYRRQLMALRELPGWLAEVLERIPANAHPMDVMRTVCSIVGGAEPELAFDQQHAVADRLIALLPSAICYWHRFTGEGVRIETGSDEKTTAGHFLLLLHGQQASTLHQRCLDASLILSAEHGLDASTLGARLCAQTLADFHSAVAAAMGALGGSLHGGAREAVMGLIGRYRTADEAVAGVGKILAQGKRVMGFGHATCRRGDPRNRLVKSWSKQLAQFARDGYLFAVSEAIEKLLWTERRLYANAAFYSASVYRFMAIPNNVFTPVFACARVAGWAAHIAEQRADNRPLHTAVNYVGPAPQSWLPIEQRGVLTAPSAA